MAKFRGVIGFSESEETSPGVHSEIITERIYSGDIVRNSRRWQSGENLNDDLLLANEFGILADPYLSQNLRNIRYVKWQGAAWKVVRIDHQRPRLILTLGGVYNGNTDPTPDSLGEPAGE